MDEPHESVADRWVKVPCPTGMHEWSIVTFRDHTVVALLCVPCEVGWTQSSEHPEDSGWPGRGDYQ